MNKQVIERAVWASKLLLLCVGALSTATLVKVTVIPYVLDQSLSVWESFRGWVSLLYTYLAVQFIIAAIALSSSFHRLHREPGTCRAEQEEDMVNVKTGLCTGSMAPLEKSGSRDRFRLVGEANTCQVHKVSAGVNELAEMDNVKTIALEKSSSWDRFPLVGEVGTVKAEKVNARASDTKTVNARINRKITAQGALGDKVNDGRIEAETVNATEEDPSVRSMDDTWRAIVEGRQALDRSRTMVPARRLERIDRQDNRWPTEKEVKKWRTVNDRVSLTREESMSPEELRLRAEAFIKKVEDDMRLQRLESDERFMDMLNLVKTVNARINRKITAQGALGDKVNDGRIEAETVNETEEDPPVRSMDDTWRAIVEGRQALDRSRTMAPARQLERIDRQDNRWPTEKEVKKWRTVNDRVSLTREESMSPEELRLRAEAFIKKVKDDMRLQRLESDEHFMDMLNLVL